MISLTNSRSNLNATVSSQLNLLALLAIWLADRSVLLSNCAQRNPLSPLSVAASRTDSGWHWHAAQYPFWRLEYPLRDDPSLCLGRCRNLFATNSFTHCARRRRIWFSFVWPTFLYVGVYLFCRDDGFLCTDALYRSSVK